MSEVTGTEYKLEMSEPTSTIPRKLTLKEAGKKAKEILAKHEKDWKDYLSELI